MTKSTITREQVIALIAEHSYDSALVDALEHLLATMDSEPVAFTEKHEISNMHATGIYLRAWPADRARNAVEGYTIPLYLHAQPAPVVPEEKPIPNTLSMYAVDAVAAIAEVKGWNACRAAMLAAAPQSPGSEPATVPGKWIPVSERVPEEGGRYWCYVEKQNSLGKSHYQWNCSWNGDVWSDKALTGRVTHWMPLPAAPQEVK
ncbi:DUF551 domain-containing protein [Klebsiella pneumoniae]